MYTHPEYANAAELRFILNVMEERSHLGLDNESANGIRHVLRRRIADAEQASAKIGVSRVASTEEQSELMA